MTVDAVWRAFVYGVWVFYAFGPQLLICLALGYFAARRSSGSMVHWLVVAFLASVVPLAGVVLMLVLYRRTGVAARAVSKVVDHG